MRPESLEEIVGPASKRGIVGTVIVALFGFAVASFLGWWVIITQPEINPGYSWITIKFNMLRAMEEPVDTLIIGDSAGTIGVNPRVVNKHFGGTSINLATILQNSILGDPLILESYLDKFGPPKRVIVVHTHQAWVSEIMANALGQMPLQDALDHMDTDLLTFNEKMGVLLGRFMPLYVHDVSIPKLFMYPWDSRIVKDPRLSLKLLRFTGTGIRSTGFVPYPPGKIERVLNAFPSRLKAVSQDFRFSPSARAGIARVFELAAIHEFPVYLVNSPVEEELAATEEFRKFYAGAREALISVAVGERYVHVMELDPLVLPASQFFGVNHAAGDAARLYSEWVAESVLHAEASE